MPKVRTNLPDTLRPYLFHGVDLVWRKGDKEALGQCPSCGKPGKFSVNITTGASQCFTCAEGWNATTFLRKLWDVATAEHDQYERLRVDRGLLQLATLVDWELVVSPITGDWLVPGYNASGALCQLYRYMRRNGRSLLLPTPTLGSQLYGRNLYQADRPWVFVCEGPWDGMMLWEVLKYTKQLPDDTLAVTGGEGLQANVLAVPGAGVFKPAWAELLADKIVYLMYDNDHPRPLGGEGGNSSSLVAGAGLKGMQRVAGLLSGAAKPPQELHYLRWGTEGYDRDLPSGYDLRDWFAGAKDRTGRVNLLASLLERVVPVPDVWLKERGTPPEQQQLEPLECTQYRTLTNAWRKALKWTDGLDYALSVMLAAVASVKLVGDQLWVKVIGPPASGKSTLCEALSVNRRYVLAKSTIRGFHSGYKTDATGSEDNSLVAQLNGKALVTKDGDTLLQAPNLGQILAEGRDLYDSTSRTHYRNKLSRDYSGIRMSWILSGTRSLRTIDNSELGERFLDCVIMEGIDTVLEDAILWRVANRVDRTLSYEADGSPVTHQEPDLTLAMQLTGGYINYLRANAVRLVGGVVTGQRVLRRVIALGKFVAYMRARPNRHQTETAEREFAARLVSQHLRLAKCLAVVLGRRQVDDEVLRRVRRVALDTSRGVTLDIVKQLYAVGEDGLEPTGLDYCVPAGRAEIGRLLKFLGRIGVVEHYRPAAVRGVRRRARWRLAGEFKPLYEEVMRRDED